MKINNKSREIKYPTVQVSFCKDYDIYREPIGAHYCPKCNAIVLRYATLFIPKEKIIEELIEILDHETMHWWLCNNINEEASIGFDMINEPNKNSKEDLEIPNDLPIDLTPFLPENRYRYIKRSYDKA